ncbi:MAG: adenylosuccinate synthase [Gemmatimonadetes bacterium]|uniref:Adenylosuccinate synthetase n=1 Tax=Candidatus Kutchimonas denitrificans TaxID=3056748 RepID=A0AAE5CA48_9BACT|nr:adenylosuccinate synthase [Gemmatimonadota bacterium]NIR76141.1 adenylosuccinate synthase [Candidatus Kutchimonas denitrificans]NIS00520.1 adenylosuccinate synthase [Gemmatimonadota bacterium]NIT66178.1 adenylosuccinate synthase [Gemmatimonadota bacterium]NIU54256.1 adenylosuccinate synthase [Gemmatimonadota bacterium]
MFDGDVRGLVVVGSQWGDEGKGKIVDVLARDADWIARYQGGANAGHTVRVGEDEFILHQIPSGILYAGKRCVLGNGMVLDPAGLFDELDGLMERGYEDAEERIYVSSRAQLVLPIHKLLDRAEEESRGADRIGTTGRGIGAAYTDKVARVGIRVGDLAAPDRLKEQIDAAAERARKRLQLLGSDLEVDGERLFDETMSGAERLLAMSTDVGAVLKRALDRDERVLLEGAQGTMLDVDHGTYPYVTSSNTTAGAAATGVGLGPTDVDAVLGVVKAYTTRVGAGPLPTELPEEEAARLRELGAEYGATTGRPRRTGWFDAAVVRYAGRINGLTALAVSKLDVLDGLPEVKLGVGYRLGGERLDEFPADLTTLCEMEPIYEAMPGWQASTAEARRVADLPAAARAYLDRIAELTGRPIRYISVGTRRKQIIDVEA